LPNQVAVFGRLGAISGNPVARTFNAGILRLFSVFMILFSGEVGANGLTRGEPAGLKFDVGAPHVVQFDLQSSAFIANNKNLKTEWLESIDTLLKILEVEPAILRMTYFVVEQELNLTRERAEFLKSTIATRWEKSWGHYELPIEIRIVYQK
jgi:hypothetical protein